MDALTVEILDADGNVIQSYEGTPSEDAEDSEDEDDGGWWGASEPELAMEAGLHSFNWNLRYPGSTSFPGIVMWAASTEVGPIAPPGQYTVRLTADGETLEQDFEIGLDPRRPQVTAADL
ncbi:MAG: glycosyl hydrolase, partial [Gemmatimonadetes bacterium]|nr:glycosyl hydrolase [Gemmatimonadota bacterium]